jgi:uncharacterized protein YjeT (DUF2065 family)
LQAVDKATTPAARRPTRARASRAAVSVALAPDDTVQLSRDRQAELTAAEARQASEEHAERAQTRLWGIVAVVIGLLGCGAGLLAATPDAFKAIVPVAAAIVGVLAGIAAAHAPHGTLRRRFVPSARREEPPTPTSLARVGDALAKQRRSARQAAITVWRDA